MRRSTTKILSTFLLCLFGTPFLFILFFHIKQQVIRHRMKEQLEEKMLQSVTVSKKDVHWIKPGKEILVNGKLFDVESTRDEADFIVFTGLYDEDETLLVTLLNDLQHGNSDRDNELLVQLFECIDNVFCSSLTQADPWPGKTLYFIDRPSPALADQIKAIPSPPPQA